MNLHREVRCQIQVLGLSQRRKFEELGDAADTRGIRLDDVRGTGLNELDVFGDAGQHLPGGDRGVQRPGQLCMALGVIGIQRFLDPDQVETLEQPAHPLCAGPVPLLIGIDHQGNVITQMFPDTLDPGDVGLPVRLPDLDLDAADAARQGVGGILDDLLDRRVQEPTGGVVSADRIPVGAEQFGQRQVRALGLEVPQCDVDGGDRLCGQPTAANGGARPDQFRPDLADVARILADQNRSDLLGVRELARPAGAFGVAEADALVAVLGADLREQQSDLGHGLLPTGEHFGVADRRGQRQGDGGELDRPDPVDRGSSRCQGLCGYTAGCGDRCGAGETSGHLELLGPYDGGCGASARPYSGPPESTRAWRLSPSSHWLTFMAATTAPARSQNAVNSRDLRSPRRTSSSRAGSARPRYSQPRSYWSEKKNGRSSYGSSAPRRLPATCAPWSLAAAQCSTRTRPSYLG